MSNKLNVKISLKVHDFANEEAIVISDLPIAGATRESGWVEPQKTTVIDLEEIDTERILYLSIVATDKDNKPAVYVRDCGPTKQTLKYRLLSDDAQTQTKKGSEASDANGFKNLEHALFVQGPSPQFPGYETAPSKIEGIEFKNELGDRVNMSVFVVRGKRAANGCAGKGQA